MNFRKLPHWAQPALLTAAGTASVHRGIARAQREEGVLLLQLVYREKRALATVVQYPFKDVQDAYAKANEMEAGEVVCYFIIATEPALRRAEAGGVAYMRVFSGVPGGGAVLRVPYAEQFSRKEES